MPFARCPLCDDILTIAANLDVDNPVTCPTCLSNLKLVSLDPCELEEANRRPPRPQTNAPRPYNNNARSDGAPGSRPGYRPGDGRPAGERPGSNRPPLSGGSNGQNSSQRPVSQPPPGRRPYVPPPMPDLPPNPDKLMPKRPQRWDKPKEEEELEDHDEFNEMEDKFLRRSGKGRKDK